MNESALSALAAVAALAVLAALAGCVSMCLCHSLALSSIFYGPVWVRPVHTQILSLVPCVLCAGLCISAMTSLQQTLNSRLALDSSGATKSNIAIVL